MSTLANHSLRAGVVAIAPVILLASLGYHPYLAGRQPNIDALAAEVIADPTRWGIVHVATGVASAVLAVAFLAIRGHLHELGEPLERRRAALRHHRQHAVRDAARNGVRTAGRE